MTAIVPIIQEHIEIVEGASGPKARIVGHLIRVKDIVIWHQQQDMSVDEIIELFPDLTCADIHAALAYYWDHRDELDASIAADEAFIEEMRRSAPPSRLQEKRQQPGL